jgi:hypothetical protein
MTINYTILANRAIFSAMAIVEIIPAKDIEIHGQQLWLFLTN